MKYKNDKILEIGTFWFISQTLIKDRRNVFTSYQKLNKNWIKKKKFYIQCTVPSKYANFHDLDSGLNKR